MIRSWRLGVLLVLLVSLHLDWCQLPLPYLGGAAPSRAQSPLRRCKRLLLQVLLVR